VTSRAAMIQAHRIASQRLVAPPTKAELARVKGLDAEATRRIQLALEQLQASHFDRAHLAVKR
jgi:hypothetical protein